MGCGGNAATKYEFDGKVKQISIKDQQKISKLGKSSVAKRKIQNMVIECAKSIAGKYPIRYS